MAIKNNDYVLLAAPVRSYPAPELPYEPRTPRHYRPAIGLIACGGITHHHLTAYRAAGYRVVALCELLSAIDENREPSNSARDNLHSLELCFAAVASAERHEPVVPGRIRRLPRARGW